MSSTPDATRRRPATVPDNIPLATTDPKIGAVDLQPGEAYGESPGAAEAGLALHASAAALSRVERRYVTAALMLVMVLASMEQTVTSTAMPTIIGDLHGLEHYSWVASIYLLACTVTMPLYGRMSDTFGRKRVVVFSIVLFIISSVLAASSKTMIQLVCFRGLQGIGAGGIMPVVLTILGDIYTLKERAAIQGLFSAVWGTASLAGPALGWALVENFGWRSCFFVNLPFGVIALAVLVWKYRDVEKPHTVDLDLPGAATLAIACLTLLTLVSRLGPGGWTPAATIELALLAVVTTAYFLWHEQRAENPIMPPALMLQRAIGPSMIGSCLLGVAFLSLDTYVPLYVQGGRGGGAGGAASVVTPVMLTWALSGIVSAPMVVRWGFRRVAAVGAALTIIGFTGLLACALSESPRWMLTGVLAITGFGFGPASMSYLLAAQHSVEWQQRGIVTSSVQFFRTMGGAAGIGVLGAVFNILAGPGLNALRGQNVTPGELLDPKQRDALSPGLLHQAEHVIAHSLTWVFAAMLAFAVIQLLVTALMPAGKPEQAISKAELAEALAG